MSEKVLIVDDDANLLQGLRRQLRKKFDMKFAEGGVVARDLIDAGEEFAVIVSDMQMPDFNGLQLLCHVREVCCDTTRIMLTGNADQKTATDAVNDGAVFRFISKPCDPVELETAINDALEHHRLVRAEKEVLEHTLKGSIELMTDVLSLLNPTAFGRANRVRSVVKSMCKTLGLKSGWQIEMAATFAQVGRATVPVEVLEKSYANEPLTEEQAKMMEEHPIVAAQLVGRIPRLELVGEIISRKPSEAAASDRDDPVQCAADLLDLVLTYDAFSTNHAPSDAVAEVRKLPRFGDREDWTRALNNAVAENYEVRSLLIDELQPGMVLDEDIYDSDEILVVTKGQEVTESLIFRLQNFKKANRKITEPIRVRNDVEKEAAVTA